MDTIQNTQEYYPNQPYNVTAAFQSPTTILEPAEYDSETGTMRLQLRPFNLQTDDFGDHMFLQRLGSLPIELVSYSSRKHDWDYTSRHKAQPITPFLFLGPVSAARDATFMQETGITMVIAVRSAKAAMMQPKLLQPSRFPTCAGLETATFDVDNPYQVITGMKPILKSMNVHLDNRSHGCALNSPRDVKGKILIMCESGNERSPALVAAYIMLLYGFSWKDAVNFIHAHRFSISLNSSMNDMLRTWEGLLKARFDTTLTGEPVESSLSSDHNVTRIGKRNLDAAYEDTENILMSEETNSPRPGMAPFSDMRNCLEENR